MKSKTIYVAFSNQKGGVGKSAFTTLAASYLHYAGGKNVAVIDCDYPQHSIHAMRERDRSMVTSSDMYKGIMVSQFAVTGKKAYPVLAAKPEDAIGVAAQMAGESPAPVDVVFFDLPGTVNSADILKATASMDYIFCSVTTDRLVMKSSLVYASILQDFLGQHPAAPLKSISLFWNMIVKTENRELYDAYTAIIGKLNLKLLKMEIPFTIRYKKEMSASSRQVFRSTLFPPDRALLKGTNLDLLVNEVCRIINMVQDNFRR